ncbi:MAG: signal peptide peptidase SppA [Acidobacteriota bacterium]
MAIRRGVGLVITLVMLAILVSLIGMVVMLFIVGREPAVASNSVLMLRVAGDLNETAAGNVLDTFMSARRATLRTVVDNLHKAKVDKRVSSVVLMPANLTSAYWGKLQEIRDAIVDFKRSGKTIVAFLEYGGDREYFLATACDRVFLTPASPLDLAGLATYELFLRGTLDKIGAFPDFLHIGDYKTAPNQLTEKTFTPAHREMAESINRDLYDQLVQAIADGRHRTAAEVRDLIDNGPFLPEDAVTAGLVDDVAYEDQLDDKVKLAPTKTFARLDSDAYSRISASSLGLGSGPRIAVIYAVGLIASGRSGYDPLNGPVVGSDTIVEYIRQARGDRSIKAIVLRVDSPGGSSVASDVIWRELMLTSHGTGARPLVASMSDLAASGGYYIAMAAPEVVAQPGTLTGSIGIYSGKIVTGGTYEKLGMNVESVTEGKNAGIGSPVRPFNASERAKLQEQLQAFYEQFVDKVAESRHMTPEAVDAVAQGRVWTGRQAKRLGLVDALGGLDRAVELAKARAKIAPGAQVELVVYPPKKSLFDLLGESLPGLDQQANIAALLGIAERRAVATLTAPMRLFRRGEPLALMPAGYFR